MVSVIDDEDHVRYEKRLPNDLDVTRCALMPYRDERGHMVAESTDNGYWLVDGSKVSGFDVRLANTLVLKPYNGLQYTDDKTDTRYRAHLLRLGMLPEGYIYPLEMRCVRDSLRRRSLLVRQRVRQHLGLQSLFGRRTR